MYYSDHGANLCQQKCFFVLTTHSQIVAKVGLMHLIATNACIVIRTLVKESSKEMAHGSDGLNPNMIEFGVCFIKIKRLNTQRIGKFQFPIFGKASAHSAIVWPNPIFCSI